jgi:hypothetical protein
VTVPVSGFTFVRNADLLDFPLEASIRSILPLCDEVVVNVGRSDDDTLGRVRAIADPRIRVVESEWDLTVGRRVLADQTDIARRACRHRWGMYIQADEVLHEDGVPELRAAIDAADADPRVEGLVVRYRHFYGGFDTELVARSAYRREVRVIRLDPALDVHSYHDAQGFRVGPDDRRVRARLTGAQMFHYGWARPATALARKKLEDERVYAWSDAEKRYWESRGELLPWVRGLRPFTGRHPAVAAEWLAARRTSAAGRVGPRRPLRTFRERRHAALDLVERWTGRRPFEFRNYTLV